MHDASDWDNDKSQEIFIPNYVNSRKISFGLEQSTPHVSALNFTTNQAALRGSISDSITDNSAEHSFDAHLLNVGVRQAKRPRLSVGDTYGQILKEENPSMIANHESSFHTDISILLNQPPAVDNSILSQDPKEIDQMPHRKSSSTTDSVTKIPPLEAKDERVHTLTQAKSSDLSPSFKKIPTTNFTITNKEKLRKRRSNPNLKDDSMITPNKNDLRLLQIEFKYYPPFIIPFRSRFKVVWDAFFQLGLMFICAYLPVQIAFFEAHDLYSGFPFVSYIIILTMYWVDILLRLRTTYLAKDFREVLEWRKLAKRYVTSFRFYRHILSSFPFFLVGYTFKDQNNNRYLLATVLLRLFDMSSVKLEKTLAIALKRIWNMGVTIFKFTIIIHWATCAWFLFAYQVVQGGFEEIERWLPMTLRTIADPDSNERFTEPGNLTYKYMLTCYSIMILMTGNDIVPTSTFQTGFSIIISIIGNMGIGFIFGKIGFLIQKMNQDETLYQEKHESLQRSLIQNKVPLSLRSRVFEYFDVYWEKKKTFNRFSDFVELSEPLQRELAFHIHQDLVKHVPLFRELEASEIFGIIKKLKASVYMPEDRIIREGDLGQEMYFISEGSVQVVVKRAYGTASKHTIILSKGAHFGEIALISNSRRTSDVISIDFCVLQKFTKQDYLSIQQEFADIKVRLRKGLKLFKENQSSKIAKMLKKTAIFETLDLDTLRKLVREYMQEKFLDPMDIILKPKNKANAIYLVLLGTVKVVDPTDIGIQRLAKNHAERPRLDASALKQKMSDDGGEQASNMLCLDDEVEKGTNMLFDSEEHLEGRILQAGDYFGDLTFEDYDSPAKSNNIVTPLANEFVQALEHIKSKTPKIFKDIKACFSKANPNKVLEEQEDKADIKGSKLEADNQPFEALKFFSSDPKSEIIKRESDKELIQYVRSLEQNLQAVKKRLDIV